MSFAVRDGPSAETIVTALSDITHAADDFTVSFKGARLMVGGSRKGEIGIAIAEFEGIG
jgi:hypothetical protein